MTNLGGMCVLRRITKDDDFVGELARKVREWRNPKFTEHSIKEMMDQRVLQIAAGYEDADDCDLLRKDGMMKLMVGRLPSGGDLCSQPTMTRLENHVQHKELYDMGWAFVRHFVESYDKEPVKIILDLDDSNANCYGAQQLSVFNGYYGEHCYMPLFIFEGFSGKLVVPILRPGRTNKRDNVAGLLIRLITYLRKFWPDTVIVVRGDGMFSSSEFMEWANGQKNLHYVLGFSGNSRLSQRTAAWVARAEEQYRRTGQDVKVYHRFMYRATRWERAQWIVVKMEFNAEGKNVRYVVTDMYHKPPRDVYANWYCKHGNCELYIYDKFIVMQSSHTHADAKLLIA
ncbi:MAG: IS1380 family transposase [Prevotella sp.]|nr:IS1380 family transposase [Prevotella sp.]